MSQVRPDTLRGVDRQIYEELRDFDVTLTPVLCYIGGTLMINHLLQEQTTAIEEKTVYSFTMDDLDQLKEIKKTEKRFKHG